MPILPNYTAQIGESPLSGGRRASADDFSSSQGMLEFGRTVQGATEKVLQITEEEEARKAIVESTRIHAEYARQLDEAAVSGADTAKLKEKMLNDLAAVGSGFQTKRGQAELNVRSSRAELIFDSQAQQIAAAKAWAEAQRDGYNLSNSVAAHINIDPSYLKTGEGILQAYVDTVPGLTAAQRIQLGAQVKQEANMAAVMSVVRNAPQDALKRLDAGEWNIDIKQRESARNAAERNIKEDEALKDRERARVDRERRDQAVAARDKYTKLIDAGEGSAKLRAQIRTDEAFNYHPELREHLLTWIKADQQRLSNQERKGDDKAFNDFYRRIVAPEGSPDKLYTDDEMYASLKKHTDGGTGLNMRQMETLRGVLAGSRDEFGRKFGSRLNTQLDFQESIMAADPLLKYMDAGTKALVKSTLLADATRRANDIRAGKDGKARSPDGMFDPKSPDFYFTPTLLRDTVAKAQKEKLDYEKRGPVDLTKTPDAWRGLKAGDMVINPKGQVVTVTQATLDALKKSESPQATSGKIRGAD